jgi:maintenance of morphology protein 1
VQLHDPAHDRQHIHACLLPDFHLNLKTTSLLGSRAKLQGGPVHRELFLLLLFPPITALISATVMDRSTVLTRADIPKLEQLIVSRIRAVIQDRFVHPHHLSLALPRLLSPSISPTPVISNIGEGAVAAMGEAVKQGLSRMVEDLGSSFDGSHLTSSPEVEARSLNAALQEQQQLQQQQQQSRSPPLSPRAGRKIPMPAGFPISGGSTYASDSTTPIPMQTPNASGSAQASQALQAQIRRSAVPPSNAPSRPAVPVAAPSGVTGTSSSYQATPGYAPSSDYGGATSRGDGGIGAGSAPMPPPSVGQSEASGFRFRGHFSSQPNTPGLGVGGGGGLGGERHMGVLNSRAG